jgi:hypothetical protein
LNLSVQQTKTFTTSHQQHALEWKS